MNNEPSPEELNKIEAESYLPVPIGYNIIKLITGETIIGKGTVIGELLNVELPFYVEEVPDIFMGGTTDKMHIMLYYYNVFSSDDYIIIHDNKIVTISKASDEILKLYIDCLRKNFGGISDLEKSSEALGVRSITEYRKKLDEIIKLDIEPENKD